MLHSRVGSWPQLQTLDKVGKANRNKYSGLLQKLVNYGCKSFVTLGPGYKGLPGTNALDYLCRGTKEGKFHQTETRGNRSSRGSSAQISPRIPILNLKKCGKKVSLL